MALAVWPSSLPQNFNIEGYRRKIGDGRAVSPVDAGPAKMRMRFRPPKPVSGAMMMTSAQFDTLESFIMDDLDGGVLPFSFPAQPGPGMWLVRFDPRAALPEESGSEFDAWAVTVALEILP